MSEITVSWDASPTPGATYDVFRGTVSGNESATAIATGIANPSPMVVTSVAYAPSGRPNIRATGTFPGGAANALVGMQATFSGFANAVNNGVFVVTASTATSVDFVNDPAIGPDVTAQLQLRPFYTDTAVTPGKVYFYEIDAVVNGVHSVDSVEVASARVPFGPTPATIPMGSAAAAFEVLAGSTATNTGASVIDGDVGVSPGTSITGFDSATVEGNFHAGDFVAAQAQLDLTAAFNAANAAIVTGAALTGDIGGDTLLPGVYSASSSLGITGTLNLDAQGNPDAVWIFQIGSTLGLAAASSVALLNGAQAQNVFWAVGSSATLNGPNSTMVGNVMAQASISATAGVTINGRLLARTGAVTLIDDFLKLFISGRLTSWSPGLVVQFGDIIFDCATGTFQEAIQAGTTGATRPIFGVPTGTLTDDGTVIWQSLDHSTVIISVDLPPAPPNVAPPPPAAPTNPAISSEM
jgi:hypothetical protein